MANSFISLTVPSDSSTGAETNVSALAYDKTVIIARAYTGDLFIEGSLVGGGVGFVPVLVKSDLTTGGYFPLNGDWKYFRVRRNKVVPGTVTPAVTVGAQAI